MLSDMPGGRGTRVVLAYTITVCPSVISTSRKIGKKVVRRHFEKKDLKLQGMTIDMMAMMKAGAH